MRRAVLVAAALALPAGLPAPAAAHLVSSGLGPFYDGGLHLLLSPADLLAVLALSLSAARGGRGPSRSAVVALTVAWGAACLAGLALGALPFLGWPKIGLLTAIGVAVAAGIRPSAPAVAAAGVLTGALFGLDNGGAIAAAGGGAVAAAGVTAGVAILTLLASALAVSLQAAWMQVALRIAGSWIAAVGMLMLGWLAQGAR